MSIITDILGYIYVIAGKEMNLLGIVIGLDKLIHIIGMIILGFLFYTILFFIKGKKRLIFTTIIIFLIGILKELIDLYIRNTYFSIGDIIANSIGIIIFLIILLLINKK